MLKTLLKSNVGLQATALPSLINLGASGARMRAQMSTCSQPVDV